MYKRQEPPLKQSPAQLDANFTVGIIYDLRLFHDGPFVAFRLLHISPDLSTVKYFNAKNYVDLWKIIRMIGRMRNGYGYNVTEAAFAHAGVDRVWLDVTGSGRRERGAMLEMGNLREGDTLVLLSASDISENLARVILDRGAMIETCPPVTKPKRPGAPLKFDPDLQQDDAIRALWLNAGYTLAYVKRRAGEIMGKPVARHQLTHRYGNRHKREPK